MDYREIDVGKIDVGVSNVRKRNRERDLDDLAKSIDQWGVLQPVVVCPKGDRFDLILGQRRLLACKRLGKRRIPAVVVKAKDEIDAKILSISENIQRADLNYSDQAEVVGFLYDHFGSAKKVAKLLGKSLPYVYDYLRIEKSATPGLRKMLGNKEVGRIDANRIIKVAGGDDKKAVELAGEIGRLTEHEKDRLLDVGKRKPELSARELIAEAKRARVLERLVIPLTPRLAEALDNAAADIGAEREHIAKGALAEWLSKRDQYHVYVG